MNRPSLAAFAMLTMLCYCVPLLGMAQDAPPSYVVKAWLEPAKVVTGRRVQLHVLIGVDTYFSEGTSIVPPELEHALVLHNEPAVSGMRDIDGTRYAAQLQVLDIYPDQAGIFVVPSFAVSFSRAITVNGELVNKRERYNTQLMLMLVHTPAALQDSGFMVSPAVQVDESWTLPAGKQVLAKGDIIQRVITVSAEDMAPMNMPEVSPRVPHGVEVVQAEPSLSSVNARGVSKATIAQHFSYVIHSPGQYRLGGEALRWWDPELGAPKAYRFEQQAVDAGGVPWPQLLGGAGGTLLLILLLILLWAGRRRGRVDSRERSIARGIRSGDARQRMASLYAYGDYHGEAGTGPALLQAAPGVPAASARELLAARYGARGSDRIPSRQQSRVLYRQMKKARKKN